MKNSMIMVIFLAMCGIVSMGKDLASPPLQIEGTKLPTQSDAKRVAFEAYVKKMNLEILAEEGVREREIAIVTLGYDVRDFAAKGERIWEVRVLTIEGRLRSIVWINPNTEKVYFICGPWDEKNKSENKK